MAFRSCLWVSQRGSDHRLETGQGVVIGKDSSDPVPIRLGLDRFRFHQLQERRGAETIPLLSESQLLIGPDLILLFDEGSFVSRSERCQTRGQIGLQGKLLLPHTESEILLLRLRRFDLLLTTESLKDGDAHHEGGRRRLLGEVEGKTVVPPDQCLALGFGELKCGAIRRGEWVGQASEDCPSLTVGSKTTDCISL